MTVAQKSVRSPRVKVPSLCLHKPTGQGFVLLNGKMIYLGKHDDPKTVQSYHRTVAEWLAAGGRLAIDPELVTVDEILAQFLDHAKIYYRRADGSLTCEYANMIQAARPLLGLYSGTPAAGFGPLALKAVRQKMITLGWCRNTINSNISRLKTVFRWATEQELIPGNIYHALFAVKGLARGRCGAKESEDVKPVPMNLVEAIKPFVSPQIWALIQLQLLTAARPGELCMIRKKDIDRSGKVWIYKPDDHKTAHHGHERSIYLGPKAQEILTPFMLRPDDAYMLSPQDAMREWLEEKHAQRSTPLNCGNRPGTNKKPQPERVAGEHYTTASYARAIERACKAAFPPPEPLCKGQKETNKQHKKRINADPSLKKQYAAFTKKHHWHPHQLRHNAGTVIRKEFGLEATFLDARAASILLPDQGTLGDEMDLPEPKAPWPVTWIEISADAGHRDAAAVLVDQSGHIRRASVFLIGDGERPTLIGHVYWDEGDIAGGDILTLSPPNHPKKDIVASIVACQMTAAMFVLRLLNCKNIATERAQSLKPRAVKHLNSRWSGQLKTIVFNTITIQAGKARRQLSEIASEVGSASLIAYYGPQLLNMAVADAAAYLKRLLAGDLNVVTELDASLSTDEWLAKVKANTARWENVAQYNIVRNNMTNDFLLKAAPILASILLALVFP